ncbi:MAG: hypothetical protein IPH64_06670 [Comamonadaceae bacterium]|nr:hypothetical protein [Comamonadaceae bacterium]
MLISTAVGLCSTLALIRGWHGFADDGVTSGAWAAVASHLIALAWTGGAPAAPGHHALAPTRRSAATCASTGRC